MRAALEVSQGIRPMSHISHWLTPAMINAVHEHRRTSHRHGIHPAVSQSAQSRPASSQPAAASSQEPDDAWEAGYLHRPMQIRRAWVDRDGDTAEATVVVEDEDRVRVAAAALEIHRGAWRFTALELG